MSRAGGQSAEQRRGGGWSCSGGYTRTSVPDRTRELEGTERDRQQEGRVSASAFRPFWLGALGPTPRTSLRSPPALDPRQGACQCTRQHCTRTHIARSHTQLAPLHRSSNTPPTSCNRSFPLLRPLPRLPSSQLTSQLVRMHGYRGATLSGLTLLVLALFAQCCSAYQVLISDTDDVRQVCSGMWGTGGKQPFIEGEIHPRIPRDAELTAAPRSLVQSLSSWAARTRYLRVGGRHLPWRRQGGPIRGQPLVGFEGVHLHALGAAGWIVQGGGAGTLHHEPDDAYRRAHHLHAVGEVRYSWREGPVQVSRQADGILLCRSRSHHDGHEQ